MTRSTLAAALLIAVLLGGFIVGAVNAAAGESWPDW